MLLLISPVFVKGVDFFVWEIAPRGSKAKTVVTSILKRQDICLPLSEIKFGKDVIQKFSSEFTKKPMTI